MRCDPVVVVRQGKIVESGPTARLFAAPPQAYMRELLEAISLPDVGRALLDPAAWCRWRAAGQGG